ncbi:hypothetical protein [Xanthomonas oryzae]|uniref:hypothetical protein n=1 Tax=Xanthomonas oryzae TaxID=347 RepID=UPI0013EF9C5D|nr:hypothetical protein [Xanthomonas oryzae]
MGDLIVLDQHIELLLPQSCQLGEHVHLAEGKEPAPANPLININVEIAKYLVGDHHRPGRLFKRIRGQTGGSKLSHQK